MSGRLVPVVKASPSRTRRRKQERKAGKIGPRSTNVFMPQLVQGKAGRELAALERQAHELHAARQAEAKADKVYQRKQADKELAAKKPVEATPPAAAVNHAVDPAKAKVRAALGGSKGKALGAAAAGVGAAAAGGVLVHRRIVREERYLHPETEKHRAKAKVGKGLSQREVDLLKAKRLGKGWVSASGKGNGIHDAQGNPIKKTFNDPEDPFSGVLASHKPGMIAPRPKAALGKPIDPAAQRALRFPGRGMLKPKAKGVLPKVDHLRAGGLHVMKGFGPATGLSALNPLSKALPVRPGRLKARALKPAGAIVRTQRQANPTF